MGEANGFRSIFFAMTFFSIGAVSNFRKLWEEGIGRLAAVYVVCLFGFIIWIGLLISWMFFHGVKPPLSEADMANPQNHRRTQEDGVRAVAPRREEAHRRKPRSRGRVTRPVDVGQPGVFPGWLSGPFPK